MGIPGLTGQPILDFVAAADRPLARRLLKHVHAQLRIDPVVVGLVRGDGVATSTLFGACRLPDRTYSVFLSVAQVPCTLAPIDRPRDAATGLLTPDALRAAAQRDASDDGGATRQLEFVRLDGLSGAARQLPDDRAQHAHARDRRGLAGLLDRRRRRRPADRGFLRHRAKGEQRSRPDAAWSPISPTRSVERGIPDGQVSPRIARIDLSLGGLSDKDAGRALTYAMNSFVKSLGGSLDIGSLQSGLAAAMTETVSRFVDTRRDPGG